MAKGKHPVPFRTRKLSSSAPMVLRGRPRGRVGRRRTSSPEGRCQNWQRPSGVSRCGRGDGHHRRRLAPEAFAERTEAGGGRCLGADGRPWQCGMRQEGEGHGLAAGSSEIAARLAVGGAAGRSAAGRVPLAGRRVPLAGRRKAGAVRRRARDARQDPVAGPATRATAARVAAARVAAARVAAARVAAARIAAARIAAAEVITSEVAVARVVIGHRSCGPTGER
jgi:hypothetical protein